MKETLKRVLMAALCGLSFGAVAADKPDILEVMVLDGVVNDGMAEQVTKQVQEINENKRVKAVLLVVDSPGGGVLSSAVIYEELSKLTVPVVGWCNNLCASGGMYVLMSPSVKYIGVRTETISGSIGVVMHITRYHRLMDWARIDNETYKSGTAKDSGNPNRPVTDEERADLQGTIDGLAQTFYGLVEKSRGDKIKDWPKIKRAGIFFGAEGVKVGLVDQVMTKQEAEQKAKDLSGSKLIFTREEIKKMSKDGDDRGSYETPTHRPQAALSAFGDIPWVIETLKEIHAGGTVKIEMRMPYSL